MPNAGFSLIRYVPDLAKGERINIGLVWRYGDGVGIRLRDEWDKVKLFDSNVNIELLKSSADVILSAVTARGQLDDSITREFSSSVQLSPVTALPVGGESIKNVVDMVFQSLVETKPLPPDLSPDVLEKLGAIIHNFAVAELIEKGDIEGAKRAFRGIPKDAAQLESFLGVLAASNSEVDWEQASDILRRGEVQNAKLYTVVAYRWWSVGKMETAIELGEMGLQIAERSAAGQELIGGTKNSLAYYYADSGKPEYKQRALQLAREAVKASKESPQSLDTLGYTLIAYGDSREEIMSGLQLCERAWKANGPLKFFAKHVGAAETRLRSLGLD